LPKTGASSSLCKEIEVLSLVSTEHFMSHFYYPTLTILVTFLAADDGFPPTQLGGFIVVLSVVAAAAQMPVGSLVVRSVREHFSLAGCYSRRWRAWKLGLLDRAAECAGGDRFCFRAPAAGARGRARPPRCNVVSDGIPASI
jgi:hypothetical protein